MNYLSPAPPRPQAGTTPPPQSVCTACQIHPPKPRLWSRTATAQSPSGAARSRQLHVPTLSSPEPTFQQTLTFYWSRIHAEKCTDHGVPIPLAKSHRHTSSASPLQMKKHNLASNPRNPPPRHASLLVSDPLAPGGDPLMSILMSIFFFFTSYCFFGGGGCMVTALSSPSALSASGLEEKQKVANALSSRKLLASPVAASQDPHVGEK